MMLPPEILMLIFQHLDLASLVSLSQVSRNWRAAVDDDFFYRIASRDYNLQHRRFPLRQTWTESAHVTHRRCVHLISHVTSSDQKSNHVTKVADDTDRVTHPHDTLKDTYEISVQMALLTISKSRHVMKRTTCSSHTTSHVTLNCPLPRDFTVLFPTYSLQHLNNGFQQFDDGYCEKGGYVRLSRDAVQYTSSNNTSTRDLYTCSNGLVIDLPRNYKLTPSTPTVKARDAEGIWTERVDFERISRDRVSHVVVATSSSTSAVWECVSGELRVFWRRSHGGSRDERAVQGYKISRDWTRNKVQLFVYRRVVLVAVTQIHYIDWSIHSKQVWDVYQVTCDHVNGGNVNGRNEDGGNVHVIRIQSQDSSWGNILWYDGLKLCNTPQYSCDRTHVIGDTIEASQWGYGNCIRFNFDSDWIVGYDCEHKLRWIRNSVSGTTEHVPDHRMSFVGVSRGKLKACVFDRRYLDQVERVQRVKVLTG